MSHLSRGLFGNAPQLLHDVFDGAMAFWTLGMSVLFDRPLCHDVDVPLAEPKSQKREGYTEDELVAAGVQPGDRVAVELPDGKILVGPYDPASPNKIGSSSIGADDVEASPQPTGTFESGLIRTAPPSTAAWVDEQVRESWSAACGEDADSPAAVSDTPPSPAAGRPEPDPSTFELLVRAATVINICMTFADALDYCSPETAAQLSVFRDQLVARANELKAAQPN